MTTLPPPPALKPIAIGPVTVAEPVVLAPMTGVTDLPFRKLVKEHGAGLTVSEMIASQAMIREFGPIDVMYLIAAARWTLALTVTAFVGASLIGIVIEEGDGAVGANEQEGELVARREIAHDLHLQVRVGRDEAKTRRLENQIEIRAASADVE